MTIHPLMSERECIKELDARLSKLEQVGEHQGAAAVVAPDSRSVPTRADLCECGHMRAMHFDEDGDHNGPCLNQIGNGPICACAMFWSAAKGKCVHDVRGPCAQCDPSILVPKASTDLPPWPETVTVAPYTASTILRRFVGSAAANAWRDAALKRIADLERANRKLTERIDVYLAEYKELKVRCEDLESQILLITDDGCPKSDPDCEGRAEDCHDACEATTEGAAQTGQKSEPREVGRESPATELVAPPVSHRRRVTVSREYIEAHVTREMRKAPIADTSDGWAKRAVDAVFEVCDPTKITAGADEFEAACKATYDRSTGSKWDLINETQRRCMRENCREFLAALGIEVEAGP